MRVIFETEEDKELFLRVAGYSTLEDLAEFRAIFEVEEDDNYVDIDYSLFSELPF